MSTFSAFGSCYLPFANLLEWIFALHCSVHEHAVPVEIPWFPTIPEFRADFRSHMSTLCRPSAFMALVTYPLRICWKGFLPCIVLSTNTRFLLRFLGFQPFLNFALTFGLICPRYVDLQHLWLLLPTLCEFAGKDFCLALFCPRTRGSC